MNSEPRTADPPRVAAGRRNRALWKGFTPAGLERLRQAALERQPWRHSTGPRTAHGKAVCAANGRKRCRDVLSFTEIRDEIRRANALLGELARLQAQVLTDDDPDPGNP
jgi:hypothetical protein